MDPLAPFHNISSSDLILGFYLWAVALVVATLLTACAVAKASTFIAKHAWIAEPLHSMRKNALGWLSRWFIGGSLMAFSALFMIGTTGVMASPELFSIIGVASLVLTIFLIESVFMLGFVMFP